MSTSRDLYLLEARLAYVEQVLAGVGLLDKNNSASDPQPLPWRQGAAQPEAARRQIRPNVDPAPSDWPRMAESLQGQPPRGGDPAANDRVRLARLLLHRPPPGDPAASDRTRLQTVTLEGVDPVISEWIAQLLWGVDPPPEDLARLTGEEIEAAARTVSAEVVRLKSIDGLLNERLKELRGKPAGGS